MFRITKPGGFQIEFSNGVILSTQIHQMAYCDNHLDFSSGDIIPLIKMDSLLSLSCNNAEIGIMKDGKFITRECQFCDSNDDVYGFVDLEKWLQIFDWCKNYGKKEFTESL